MKLAFYLFLFPSLIACNSNSEQQAKLSRSVNKSGLELIVLGTVQDAGSPQLACQKDCCINLTEEEKSQRKVVSIGLIDYDSDKTFMVEASPDFVDQVIYLQQEASTDKSVPNGIFLSHAHMGHYTGLMYLGRESMNAQSVPVYAMPKMDSFLSSNGPWSQLVDLNNIQLKSMKRDSVMTLSNKLRIKPILVPHRDEFSETVGFKIMGPSKSVLFIPDIDKWQKWNRSLLLELEQVDYAFIDATFYDQNEIPNRNMEEIPHPFVVESKELLQDLSSKQKAKVFFIHFNHTNPLLNKNSMEYKVTLNEGFNIAELNQKFKL